MSLYVPAGIVQNYLDVGIPSPISIVSSDEDSEDWYICDWCGWWGYLDGPSVPDKYKLYDTRKWKKNVPFFTLLCMRCFELEEPPWRPNKRDLCHEWLLRIFRPLELARIDITYTLRLIAEYLAENMP